MQGKKCTCNSMNGYEINHISIHHYFLQTLKTNPCPPTLLKNKPTQAKPSSKQEQNKGLLFWNVLEYVHIPVDAHYSCLTLLLNSISLFLTSMIFILFPHEETSRHLLLYIVW